eukprot:1147899-Pelagomonas_calceolata.AAC.4
MHSHRVSDDEGGATPPVLSNTLPSYPHPSFIIYTFPSVLLPACLPAEVFLLWLLMAISCMSTNCACTLSPVCECDASTCSSSTSGSFAFSLRDGQQWHREHPCKAHFGFAIKTCCSCPCTCSVHNQYALAAAAAAAVYVLKDWTLLLSLCSISAAAAAAAAAATAHTSSSAACTTMAWRLCVLWGTGSCCLHCAMTTVCAATTRTPATASGQQKWGGACLAISKVSLEHTVTYPCLGGICLDTEPGFRGGRRLPFIFILLLEAAVLELPDVCRPWATSK